VMIGTLASALAVALLAIGCTAIQPPPWAALHKGQGSVESLGLPDVQRADRDAGTSVPATSVDVAAFIYDPWNADPILTVQHGAGWTGE
jgi:hypothetical protein